jgi:hypothetical protein
MSKTIICGRIAAAASILAAGFASSAALAQPTAAVFDVPGAVTTNPRAVNNAGTIAGYYAGSDYVYHGFVRAPGGTITTFDAPGATETLPFNIGTDGTIVGEYLTGKSTGHTVPHGFIRSPSGVFTEFDVPRPHTGVAPTVADAINSLGEVAGTYCPATGKCGGYLRLATGQLESFSTDAASSFRGQIALNSEGDVAGSRVDASGGVVHGYIRDGSGNTTLFDAPNAGAGSGEGTYVYAMNENNATAGAVVDANMVFHGFLRFSGGHIAEFDVPNAAASSAEGTFAQAMNCNGAITGFWMDRSGFVHGFTRLAKGQITTFDAPGTGQPSTFPTSISDSGAVTGNVNDASGYHGFVITGN